MEDIKAIIAKNISELRGSAGLTQMELAEKLNYSDKAVSKWERGESIPDVTVLTHIADLFGVPLDYLVRKHEQEEAPRPQAEAEEKKKIRRMKRLKRDPRTRRNRGFIMGICLILVWLIATMLFMILDMSIGDKAGMLVFIYAVPTTVLVWLIFNSIWFNSRLNFLIVSLLMWTILLSVYFTILPFFNVWMIFIPGVPGQIIILLWSMIKRKEHEEEAEAVIEIDAQAEEK